MINFKNTALSTRVGPDALTSGYKTSDVIFRFSVQSRKMLEKRQISIVSFKVPYENQHDTFLTPNKANLRGSNSIIFVLYNLLRDSVLYA